MITTATGTTLPLEDLATIHYEDSPQQIQRKNKQYQVSITMEPQSEYKKTAEKDVKEFVRNWNFMQISTAHLYLLPSGPSGNSAIA